MLKHLISQTNGYHNQDKLSKEIALVLSKLKSLKPNVGQLLVGNISQSLIFLDGTIPIYYRGTQYNIPLNIWFLNSFPYVPPTIYIVPAANMRFKPKHRHVDAKGLVYLPYLNQWNPNNSSILEAISYMSSIFSDDPPLYSVKANQNINNDNNTYNSQRDMFSQRTVQQQQFHNNAQILTAHAVGGNNNNNNKANTKEELVASITAKLQEKVRKYNQDVIPDIEKMTESQ